MLKFERGHEANPQAEVTGAGGKIIIATRDKGIARAIKLKATLTTLIQFQIMQRNLAAHTKPRTTGHRISQAR
jgi:hypothetical protein